MDFNGSTHGFYLSLKIEVANQWMHTRLQRSKPGTVGAILIFTVNDFETWRNENRFRGKCFVRSEEGEKVPKIWKQIVKYFRFKSKNGSTKLPFKMRKKYREDSEIDFLLGPMAVNFNDEDFDWDPADQLCIKTQRCANEFLELEKIIFYQSGGLKYYF